MERKRVGESWPWVYKKQRIKDYIHKEWKQRWRDIKEHKHTKYFYEGPNPNKAKGIVRMSRSRLMIWIRAITGFNFLSYHQSKGDNNTSKAYKACNEDVETFIHLLVN